MNYHQRRLDSVHHEKYVVSSQILMTKTEVGSDFTDIIDTNSKTDLPTFSYGPILVTSY